MDYGRSRASAGQVLSLGWRLLRQCYGPLALLSLAYFGLLVVLSIVPLGSLLLLGCVPVFAGAQLACARASRGGRFDTALLFDAFRSLRWLEIIVVSLAVGVINALAGLPALAGAAAILMGQSAASSSAMAVGWAMGGALIVLGLVLATWLQARLLLAHAACFEGDPGTFDVLTPIRVSWQRTRASQWSLLGVVLMMALVALLGTALLCIGLVAFALPYTIALTGAAYALLAPSLLHPEQDLGRCPSCRYDLTGVESATCPECGMVHRGRAGAAPA